MDNYIFSKNTIEFVTVGVEFCALMEKVQESEKCEFIDTTVKRSVKAANTAALVFFCRLSINSPFVQFKKIVL